MDRLVVEETIKALVKLYEGNHLPKADFSLAQLEGLLAIKLGVDISQKQLTAAFGALGINRTSHRSWPHGALHFALMQLSRPAAV